MTFWNVRRCVSAPLVEEPFFQCSQACQSDVARDCRAFLFSSKSASNSWAVPSPEHSSPSEQAALSISLLPFRVFLILALPEMHSRCEQQPLLGISHHSPLLDCLSKSDNTSSIAPHQLENPLFSLNCSHSSPFPWIHSKNNNKRQLGCAG